MAGEIDRDKLDAIVSAAEERLAKRRVGEAERARIEAEKDARLFPPRMNSTVVKNSTERRHHYVECPSFSKEFAACNCSTLARQ